MVPIQYIISAESSKSAISHAKVALKAGCKWIQLQVDDLQNSKAEKTAKEIKKLCRENDAAFLIENNIDLVKSIDADGVHLTNGMTTAEARHILGEGFLIGTNAITAEEVILNKKQSADYICCGPFNHSTANEDETLSLNKYAEIVEEVSNKGITLPLSAFGKILPEDVDAILKTGIRGIMIQISEEKISEDLIRTTLERYLNA